MGWQSIAGWILLGGAALATGLILVRLGERKAAQHSILGRVRSKFAGAAIKTLATKAYFCGLNRGWDERWRGYGVLALTDEVLYFRLWQRDLDLTIPCERIEAASIDTGEGRKTLRQPRLRVAYRGMDGETRTATWKLKRSRRWAQLIQEETGKTSKS
jgi:hypothetical protein